MGVLDSSLIKNIPSVNGWNSITTDAFTTTKATTLSNPGGYRTLLVKVTLTGGDWSSAIITVTSAKSGLVRTHTGAILNRIDGDYGVLVIEANHADVQLYATTSDGNSKTITYDYVWVSDSPLSFDIRPVQVVSKSQVTLVTGTTKYNFKMLGTASIIDVSNFKYLFVAVFSKSGSSAKRLTYTLKKALSYRDFIGDNSAVRTIEVDALNVANEYIAKTEWIPVEAPYFGISAQFDSVPAELDGVVINLLLYGVR